MPLDQAVSSDRFLAGVSVLGKRCMKPLIVEGAVAI